ncbi:GGDEF domain-containing protein [candidate division KSB3 bacterium]|uniref:GGDEF domain-containing protein n=1 Tax=candidate division KSB3 bacterium TaxID=2044937 RepID=A0A2G6KJA1_9BACT|nr:MAG: GGDEF domain-containing protein [candidate division KSB3 bacterium]
MQRSNLPEINLFALSPTQHTIFQSHRKILDKLSKCLHQETGVVFIHDRNQKGAFVTTLTAFFVNVAFYAIFPLYFTTIKTQARIVAFYMYISIVLVLGGLAGVVYSFTLAESIHISGGNLAYGAFMMSTVMLIIIERDVATFRNMIRLVILVVLFVFLGFNFLAWLLESRTVLNPFLVPAEIFRVSLWVLILGGVLILGELLLLLFIFLQVRKFVENIAALSLIYTIAFIVILCADGTLFPLLAFGLSPELIDIIFGNVSGKVVLASCYSVPMLLFYVVFRKNFSQFLDTPLQMKDLIRAPRGKLLETIYHYELRQQKLQRDNLELEQLSGYDELTRLANRRKFEQTFEAEWSRCRRNASPITLAIGDIDFFKQYNDFYGHQQGDECLKTTAALWGDIFKRPPDLAARIGGEEFAIILPDTPLEQSISNLQQFLKRLQQQNIPHSKSTVAAHVTMSIGVAGMVPHKDTSPKELFIEADQRLYAAKYGGRNRIIFDNPTPRQ